MKPLVRKSLLNVKPYVPGKPIEEVERELGITDVVKLASNENALGPSPIALKAVRRALSGINRYPDSNSFYLKKELAESLGVGFENLIMGNGSDEIIVLAARAFLNEGDEVVIARPTFLIYEIVSQVAGANIKFIPLAKGFRYDLKAMKAAINEKTKMVFIANPDNPTGTHSARAEVEGFFDGLSEDVIVLYDEAYYEFAKGLKDYPDALHYLKGQPNLIVARTFSKAYGLSGLRVGYGIARGELIGYMEKVREPFNVNILAQAAALAALKDKEFLKKTLNHTRREKEFLYKAFDSMGLSYVPSATNFVLVDIKKDAREVFIRLLEKGVIVREMNAWGMDSYIRVTVGTRKEDVKFVKALKEIMMGD